MTMFNLLWPRQSWFRVELLHDPGVNALSCKSCVGTTRPLYTRFHVSNPEMNTIHASRQVTNEAASTLDISHTDYTSIFKTVEISTIDILFDA